MISYTNVNGIIVQHTEKLIKRGPSNVNGSQANKYQENKSALSASKEVKPKAILVNKVAN